MKYIKLCLLINLIVGLSLADNSAQFNLLETLNQNGLTTFVSRAQQFGLSAQLQGDGPLTVFAPTNAAFAALPTAIASDDNAMRAIMNYHLAPNAFLTAFLTNEQLIQSQLNQAPSFNQIRINNYQTITQNLVPGIFANGKMMGPTNIGATNGVIQVLPSVMTIPAANLPTFIAGVAEVSTFNRLLQASNLVPTLQGNGPFTGFIPVDTAWNSLNAGLPQALMEPANQGLLNQLMQYHFSQITLYSPAIVSGVGTQSLLAGQNLAFGKLTVNNANLVAVDFTVNNGVFQSIDKVLIPPNLQDQINNLVPANQGANSLAITTGNIIAANEFTTTTQTGDASMSASVSIFLISIIAFLLI